MARSWTLAQMRDRAKSESDMIHSLFVSDNEWKAWINSSLCEVYDMLVQAGPANYYAATAQYTTAPGQTTYPLPDDFRSATCLYAVEPAGRRRAIEPANDYERTNYQPPQAAYSLELEYIPSAPILDVDGDSFDGVSGYEELIVTMSARNALAKSESDTSDLAARIDSLKSRIRSSSVGRTAGPEYMIDVYGRGYGFPFYTVLIAGYRLRGDDIEFYQPTTLGWW